MKPDVHDFIQIVRELRAAQIEYKNTPKEKSNLRKAYYDLIVMLSHRVDEMLASFAKQKQNKLF